MSSTTSRPIERGQVLVLFAGGIVALLIIAALAFDVGMMLVERRDEQNAADAAALAGARFVLESADYHGQCAGAPGDNKAVKAACDMAVTNGFNDADPDEIVTVHIPPVDGRYKFPGFVEVKVEGTRPSVFGGIVGRSAWPVGVFAVAGNQSNLTFPFGMLALSESKCKAMQFTGGGIVDVFGNIHSNSTGSECTGEPVSISRTGGATVYVHAEDGVCRAVGTVQDQGSAGTMDCMKVENSFVLPDPLRFLLDPGRPALPPQPMDPVGHTQNPPDYCPGATPSSKEPSLATPRLCDVGGNGAAYADLAWILYPGLYPGGIQVSNGATAYLMPGIYWVGGGGFRTTTGGSVISIAAVSDAASSPDGATWGGGVLIFNSELSNMAGGDISLGGSCAMLKLKAFHVDPANTLSIYNDIVIFQDRDVTTDVRLNGSASTSEVEGIIYVPEGRVVLNGNGGTLIVDQIIADSYLIDGNGGTINVLKRTGVDAVISGAGLVD